MLQHQNKTSDRILLAWHFQLLRLY